MEERLELLEKKVLDLERKIEKYFSVLEVNNELDFILKGGYILKEDLENLVLGETETQGETENE